MINIETKAIRIIAGDDSTMVLASNYTCHGKLPTDSNICSNNGICINTNICSCGFDFVGNECQFTTCFGKNSSTSNVCSSKGTCIGKDNCQCESGYGGRECEIYYENNAESLVYSTGLNNVFFFFTKLILKSLVN